MNVLFLSLSRFWTINEDDMYADLLREFIRHNHQAYVVTPTERREGKATQLIREENSIILKVKTGNIQKTNVVEKGISTLRIESQFLRAIKKYYKGIIFDLVLYPTPPITFVRVIEYIKKRDNAKTYLMLKDIFPQNAVDIGMITKTGIKGLLYKYFRKKEKKLYRISNRIGCMSQANVDYVIRHNQEVDPDNVEVCPNAIEVSEKSVDDEERKAIRAKYGIPTDKKVFVYGGNLGRPQGIPFIIECLKRCSDMKNVFFLIIGSGTEYVLLEQYANNSGQKNLKLMKSLPKNDYDSMVGACDVGLIFLDHRFTIPNFPSRLLSYMQAKLPVFAVTDTNTDIGNVITGVDKLGNKVHEPFGWWCESNNVERFKQEITKILGTDMSVLSSMKTEEWKYLCENYSSGNAYKIIVRD